MVKIEEIAEAEGRYKITADGRKYSAWQKDKQGKEIEAFKQIADKKFKPGDLVELVFFETLGKAKDGSPITYKNVTEIKTLSEEQKKEETKTDEIPKAAPVDWDTKDRRIVRQACMKVAVQLVAPTMVEVAEPKTESFAQTVIDISKKFEKYVYEGMEDKK